MVRNMLEVLVEPDAGGQAAASVSVGSSWSDLMVDTAPQTLIRLITRRQIS